MVNNMENSEEVMQILERFTRLKQKEIPKELDEYLLYVAKTGDTIFKWSSLKYLFREKLLNVIKHFHDTTPRVDEIPQYPNVDPFNYESMKSSLLERLELFTAAPFTVQRLCELLIDPRKQYSRIDKFMRALEKNILVSTIEPGRKRTESENGDSLDSMVNGELSLDVNVDIDMEGESLFNMETQNGNGNGAGNGNAADTDNGANGADSVEGEVDASTTAPVVAVAAELKKKPLALQTPNVPHTHTVDDDMQPNPKKAKLDLEDDDDEVKPKETSATAETAASAAVVTASATISSAAESVVEVKTVGKAEDAKPAATTVESSSVDTEQADAEGEKTVAASATAADDVEMQENKENKSSSGKSNDDAITTDKSKVDVDEGNPKAEKEKQKAENNPDTQTEKKKDAVAAKTAKVEDIKKPTKQERAEVDAEIKKFREEYKKTYEKVVEKQVAEKDAKEKTSTKVDAEAVAAAERNAEKEAVEKIIDPKLDDKGKETSNKGGDEAKSVTVEEKNSQSAVGDVAKAADKDEAKTKPSGADDSTASLQKSPHLETKTSEVVAEKASKIEGKSIKELTAAVVTDAVSSPSSNVTTTAALTIAKSDEKTTEPVEVKEKSDKKDDYAAVGTVGSTNVKASDVGVTAAAKVGVAVANAAAPSLDVEPKPSTTIKAAGESPQQCEKIETESVGAVAVAAAQAPTVDSTTATKIDEDIATVAAAVATPALALNDQPMEDVAPLDDMPALLPINEVVMTESSGATDMATDAIEPSKDEPAGMEVDDTSQEEAMDQ